MLKIDRMKIDQHIDTLVSQVNMEKLWPKLFEYNIYNRDDTNVPMWQEILEGQSRGEAFTATVRSILLTIKTRGPNAYKNFIESLKKIEQENLAVLLQSPLNGIPPPPGHDNNPCNRNYYDPATATEPLKVAVTKAKEFLDTPGHLIRRYLMKSKPRGLVLLISMTDYKHSALADRIAGEHDEANITALYEQIGYEVINPSAGSQEPLTSDKIRQIIREFSQNPKFRHVDSCFVIICGHGALRNSVINGEARTESVILTGYGDEGNMSNCVSLNEIVTYFSAVRCPELINKPKVFIFQQCRGDRLQVAIGNNIHIKPYNEFMQDELINQSLRGGRTYPNYSDILVICSTLPGYVSFRDNITGTWFMQTFVDVVMNEAHEHHLVDLVTLTNNRLQNLRTSQGYCQTAEMINYGFGHLYMNPGLFLN